MRVGSLCTGYGGIELGLALAGVSVDLQWIAETDPALAPLHGETRNLGDISRVDWSAVAPIDLLCAGFPCQPVSAAGRQLGDLDPRWLWPHVRAAVAELQPAHVLIENVRNLVSTQSGRLWAGILADLAALGYGVRWLVLGACHVGAAHHRHRVFALAEMGGAGVERVEVPACGSVVELLPTPVARDGNGRGEGDAAYWSARNDRRGRGGMPLGAAVALLPTPRTQDAKHASATDYEMSRDPGKDLLHVAIARDWGRFAEAVARHESIYGPAPTPTEPNRNGGPRLAPAFAEWLMCLPAGHVTAKLARKDALRAIGNGVCPPQLAAAWRLLIGENDMKCLAATVHDGHYHHCTIEPAPHPVEISHMAPCDGGKRLHRWRDDENVTQTVENDNAEEATEPYVLPARKWGDEPDPLPAPPTVLVASTDPTVNHDGDAARAYAPKLALAAAKSAFAGGWRYGFTYAAAHVATKGEPGKRGHKPAHVLHTVALRLARNTHRDSIAAALGESLPEDTISERGYAIWAREDVAGVEGKWAFSSAQIDGRQYGARQLGERLLIQGQALLDELHKPVDIETAAPTPAAQREADHAAAVARALSAGKQPPPAPPAAPAPPPLAPILPGTWGALHVGDTITGNNGQPYVVLSIESTGVWVGAGVPEVKVEIEGSTGDTHVIRQPANAPIVPASHGDHAAAAEALAAITTAGVSAQPIEEPSTVDQFSDPTPAPANMTRIDPPRGRYGWYKLPHPITGEPTDWPRVSTIMKTHADTDGLTDWKIGQALKGLSVSPDLIAMVASLDPDADKSKLREAAEQAANRAKSKQGANFGTAVDRFTERLDAGESITSMGVPDGLRADVEAYARTLRDHGYEVLPQYSQRTTLNVTHEYAGTWDRVVRKIVTGELFALDLKSNKPDAKTGGMSNYSWLEYVSQLAAYAYGEHMCTLDFTGYEPMPEVSKTKGLILHLPSGKGRGEIYGVRLERGWRNFTRSIETRKDRSEARSGWAWLIERPANTAPAPAQPVEAVALTITPAPAPAPEPAAPSMHERVAEHIAAATTIEGLGNIARNAIEAGVWSDALAALALGRDDQLRAAHAADHTELAALWAELFALQRWTPEVQQCADARAAELAQLVAA